MKDILQFIRGRTKRNLSSSNYALSLTVNGKTKSPVQVTSSTRIPGPKGKVTNVCLSKNYQAISLRSAINSMIDLSVLNCYGRQIITSDYNFGFKAKCPANNVSKRNSCSLTQCNCLNELQSPSVLSMLIMAVCILSTK